MARGFTDISSTGVIGTGYRLATTRNQTKWHYDAPGFVPGTVFGGGHQTGQTCRPASWLPIREINKQTDLHVQQYPIVMYGGTIVSLVADSTATFSGGEPSSGSATNPAQWVAVPANGGNHSVSEVALGSFDAEFGTRLKGAATLVTTETARVVFLPNKGVGPILKNAYQNMAGLFQNFDPQEVGLDILLHGWAHYPYGVKNLGGSDAAWSLKRTVEDTDTTTGTTAANSITWAQDADHTAGAGGATEDLRFVFLAGAGKLITSGPLADNIKVEIDVSGSSSYRDITNVIDWEATRAAAYDTTYKCSPIVFQNTATAIGGGLQSTTETAETQITGNWARTATVTAVTIAAGESADFTVDEIAFLGIVPDTADMIVDGSNNMWIVDSTTAVGNKIYIDEALTATSTIRVGSRVTLFDADGTEYGQRAPDNGLEVGDYFQSGNQGQVVKWQAQYDDPAQKLGRVFWVEPLGTYARHAGEKIQNVPNLNLVGNQTVGLPAHIFDEFGATTVDARGMWVNFGVK
jgi:hypothetical protein